MCDSVDIQVADRELTRLCDIVTLVFLRPLVPSLTCFHLLIVVRLSEEVDKHNCQHLVSSLHQTLRNYNIKLNMFMMKDPRPN